MTQPDPLVQHCAGEERHGCLFQVRRERMSRACGECGLDCSPRGCSSRVLHVPERGVPQRYGTSTPAAARSHDIHTTFSCMFALPPQPLGPCFPHSRLRRQLHAAVASHWELRGQCTCCRLQLAVATCAFHALRGLVSLQSFRQPVQNIQTPVRHPHGCIQGRSM